MKITVLQIEVAVGSIEKNITWLKSQLEQLSNNSMPDAIVLPELWTTGFYPTPISDYADENGNHIKEILSTLSKQYHVNIVGGTVITRTGSGIRNTCHCFNREGSLTATYSKTHLFSPMGENKHFTPGEDMTIFTIDGVRCGIAVCYDIRFPEWIRKLALKDISILFLPAAWPKRRLDHWRILSQARAIENQMFVVTANCAGKQPAMKCAGHSAIIDPWGELLAEAGEEPTIMTAELDLDVQREIRDKFNVFADRRPELYCSKT